MSTKTNVKINAITVFQFNDDNKHCIIDAELNDFVADNGEVVENLPVKLDVTDPEHTKFFELFKHVTVEDIASGNCSLEMEVSDFNLLGGLLRADASL